MYLVGWNPQTRAGRKRTWRGGWEDPVWSGYGNQFSYNIIYICCDFLQYNITIQTSLSIGVVPYSRFYRKSEAKGCLPSFVFCSTVC